MNTTPRTDALQDELLHADTYTCCQEFQKLAMKLERELSAMQARAEKAEADTARLDWLVARNVSLTIFYQGANGGGVWVATYRDRAAINAAMKEDSK